MVSTHKYCDGDGLGAGIALHHGLKHLGKKSSFVALEEPHKKYQFLNKDKVVTVFDKKKDLENPDVLLVVDTNDCDLVEPLYSFVKKNKTQVCFIDHHPIAHSHKEDMILVQPEASSTAELVYHLLEKLNVPLNAEIATSLFTSIVFDTNQFRNIKNSPNSFVIASQVVPHIKNVTLIYDNLFKNLTVDNLNFFSTVKKVEYFLNNSMAFVYLTEQYIKDCRADINQAYDLMDMVLDIKSIKYTALVVKNNDDSFKISLRSKDKNLLPLVQQFSGGGHKHSAGAYLDKGDLEEIKSKIISYFSK